MAKPKLPAALRKALERAGAWDSLPDDERTRAAKKKWLAKREGASGQGAAKKKAKRKTAPKKVNRTAAPADDPKLHIDGDYLASEHATLPDLAHLAKRGFSSLALGRNLKRAPGLAAFLDGSIDAAEHSESFLN